MLEKPLAAAALVHADPLLVSTLPEAPGAVRPVPPLPTAKVPATATAPPVAVLGVSPVDPKLMVVAVTAVVCVVLSGNLKPPVLL
jgi:hypothetical protein